MYKDKNQLIYKPVVTTKLSDFVQEKHQYTKLKTLPFIQKFRRIKVLKLWRMKIQAFKRFYYSKKLTLNLPILSNYKQRIYDYRARMYEIEQMRFFVFSQNSVLDFEEFKNI